MILGNSFKGNTGKKYFLRKDIEHTIPSDEHIEKSQDFNQWFANNHKEMMRQCIDRGCYDEDVFNHTYMYICESLMYGDAVIKCYAGYFSRAYYTNYIQSKKKKNKYSDWTDLTGVDIVDISENDELVDEKLRLLKDIFSFVEANFDENDVNIFEEYILLNRSVTKCAKSLDLKTKDVNYVVYRIRKDILRNFGKRRIRITPNSTLKAKL